MLRSFVCLTALTLGAARFQGAAFNKECLLNSADAVSDALDASVYIWASYKRCGKAGHQIQCEIDIASAVESVNSMINVILKVADKCHALHTHNQKCGMTIGKLTDAMSGLAAAAGRIDQNCPGLKPKVLHTSPSKYEYPLMCAVDLKNSARGLFSAIKSFQKTRHHCKKGFHHKECTVSVLDVSSAIANLGSFLSGAVGQCKRAGGSPQGSENYLCGQGSAAALEFAVKVAEDGMELSKECSPKAPAPVPVPVAPVAANLTQTVEIQVPSTRLYEEEGIMSMSSSTTNYLLGALLPMTAIVSFVGGRFYANRRAIAAQSREVLSDCE